MSEVKTKVIKKRFVKIIAPKLFHGQIIGESPVVDAKLLLGRKIKTNLMTLTNNPRNQSINVKFEIKNLQGDSVGTEMIGYEMSPSFLRRLIRKGRKKAEDSYLLETKDNKKMKISPFMVTLNPAGNSTLTALRKAAHSFLSKRIKELSCYEVFNDIIMNKLQSQLREQLKKIYPLKTCEIRVANIASGTEAPSSESFNFERKTEKQEPKQEVKSEKPQEIEEKKPKKKKEEQPEQAKPAEQQAQ